MRLRAKSGLRALDVITVALAGLLILELQATLSNISVRRSASPIPLPQAAQTANVAAPQPQVAVSRTAMLDRPLFDPTRRPPPLTAQNPPAPAEIPRLTGIMLTPSQKIAVFAPVTGAPIVVNQNGRFGPFTVLAISGDNVTIKGPAGVTILRSDFSDPAQPPMTPAKSTILAGGLYLNVIKIALPKVLNWPAAQPAR
jgi:hypothetical protein